MTNENDQPRLSREDAPEHGANFWGDLEASLMGETRQIDTVDADTATMPAMQGAANTAQLPKVERLDDRRAAPQSSRRLWPLGIAAAVLAILGLGALAFIRPTDPATSAEIVAGPTEEDQVVALDGPSEGEDSADESSDNATSDTDPVDVDETPSPEGSASDNAQPAGQDSSSQSDASEPVATEVPTVRRIFDAAPGADGEPELLPLDDELSSDATFLANWTEQGVTWFAEGGSAQNCIDETISSIRSVNIFGQIREFRDPQLGFSGQIGHFTLHPDHATAAWVVGCGSQLELYTGTLDDFGHVEHVDLVWLGEGSLSTSLVLWTDSTVNLNSIEPTGDPFSIAYDLTNDVITRDGDPTRAALEAGSPVERDATPMVATTDGGISYWIGEAPSTVFSACPELVRSATAETIWLRQGDGTWQTALAEETALGVITAMAIEPTTSQIAFADDCRGDAQRLFVGTIEADGRISELRESSLTPFAPGFVNELFWVDGQTLRIEIDNSEFTNIEPDRLDLRFDEGRQEGIFVSLDG